MNIQENPVRSLREALGLTQSEMAARLKTSVMTVRRCEYENRTPATIAGREAFLELEKEASQKKQEHTTP
jgi:DNA-binding transcriptional regulator YiaG